MPLPLLAAAPVAYKCLVVLYVTTLTVISVGFYSWIFVSVISMPPKGPNSNSKSIKTSPLKFGKFDQPVMMKREVPKTSYITNSTALNQD